MIDRDEAYLELVSKDIREPISDRSELLADLHRWFNALKTLKTDVELQFSIRKGRMKRIQAECYMQGPDGKQVYFAREAEYQEWRGAANTFKTRIEARMQEVKGLQQGAREKEEPFIGAHHSYPVLDIGSLTLQHHDGNKIWIGMDGEGGSFPISKVEEVLLAFFNENF